MTPDDLIRQRARELTGGHYYCDDCWYSCPLAEDGCCNEAYAKDECTCGYDKRVDHIEAALRQIQAVERERCAQIAEAPIHASRDRNDLAARIGEAIRQQRSET